MRLGAAPEAMHSTGLLWHDRRPRPPPTRSAPDPTATPPARSCGATSPTWHRRRIVTG
ncbi:hypothetical protein ACFQ1I_04625 [Kitasatospora arboriphila]